MRFLAAASIGLALGLAAMPAAAERDHGAIYQAAKPSATVAEPPARKIEPRAAPIRKKRETAAAPRPAAKKPVQHKLDERFEPQIVEYSGHAPGTIVIDTSKRYLYLVEEGGKARRYGIAVGAAGLQFRGTATIRSKREWPSWRPTENMIRRSPEKYARYRDGMKGGPGNPLGARALYLYRGDVDTHIRIHGTNQPWTIGSAASNGCFRMVNDHVIDLYDRVKIGTEVIVL